MFLLYVACVQAKDDFPIILNVCQAKMEIQLKTVTLMAHFAVLMMEVYNWFLNVLPSEMYEYILQDKKDVYEYYYNYFNMSTCSQL
jgi:hypothetical protein